MRNLVPKKRLLRVRTFTPPLRATQPLKIIVWGRGAGERGDVERYPATIKN
jgi:hypothetical protein